MRHWIAGLFLALWAGSASAADLTIRAADLGLDPDRSVDLFSVELGSGAIRACGGFDYETDIEFTNGVIIRDLPASASCRFPQQYKLDQSGNELVFEMGVSDVDLSGLLVSPGTRGPCTVSESEPVSPSPGDIWCHPTGAQLAYRAGGTWHTVTGGGEGGGITPAQVDLRIKPFARVTGGRDIQKGDTDATLQADLNASVLATSASIVINEREIVFTGADETAERRIEIPGVTVEDSDGLVGGVNEVGTFEFVGDGVAVTGTGIKRTITVAGGSTAETYDDAALTERVTNLEGFEATMRRVREIGTASITQGLSNAYVSTGLKLPADALDRIVRITVDGEDPDTFTLLSLQAKTDVGTPGTQASSANGVMITTDDGDVLSFALSSANDLWYADDTIGTRHSIAVAVDEPNATAVVDEATQTTSGLMTGPEKVLVGNVANLVGRVLELDDLHDTPEVPAANIADNDAVLIDDASVVAPGSSQLREVLFSELDKRWPRLTGGRIADSALPATPPSGWGSSSSEDLATAETLENRSALPPTTGFTPGDVISVGGELYDLTAAGESPNVLSGVISTISTGNDAGFYGLPAVFRWQPVDPFNIRADLSRTALGSSPPNNLYVRFRASNGEVSDLKLDRASGSDTATTYRYVHDSTFGGGIEARAGSFTAAFYTDATLNNLQTVHHADRWEVNRPGNSQAVTVRIADEVDSWALQANPRDQIPIAKLPHADLQELMNGAGIGPNVTNAGVAVQATPRDFTEINNFALNTYADGDFHVTLHWAFATRSDQGYKFVQGAGTQDNDQVQPSAPVKFEIPADDLLAAADFVAGGAVEGVVQPANTVTSVYDETTKAGELTFYMIHQSDDIARYAVSWTPEPGTGSANFTVTPTIRVVYVPRAGSGSSTFLGLTDTPAAFGSAGQILIVNPSGNGFVWGARSAGGGGLDQTAVDGRVRSADNAASVTQRGNVELASDTEATTGRSGVHAMTPRGSTLRIINAVEGYARTGTTTRLPASRLPATPPSGWGTGGGGSTPVQATFTPASTASDWGAFSATTSTNVEASIPTTIGLTADGTLPAGITLASDVISITNAGRVKAGMSMTIVARTPTANNNTRNLVECWMERAASGSTTFAEIESSRSQTLYIRVAAPYNNHGTGTSRLKTGLEYIATAGDQLRVRCEATYAQDDTITHAVTGGELRLIAG